MDPLRILAPVTYTARITVVDPALAGGRDQTDPWRVEPIAVINGRRACSSGHPTPADAEQWVRDFLQAAEASGPAPAMRWAVIAAGDAPVGLCLGSRPQGSFYGRRQTPGRRVG